MAAPSLPGAIRGAIADMGLREERALKGARNHQGIWGKEGGRGEGEGE